MSTSLLSRTMSILLSGVAITASVVAMGTPATAAPVPIDYNKCPDFHLCLFKAQKFGGSSPIQQAQQTTACASLANLGDSNNSTTSIINATDFQWHVYDSGNCTGTPMATIFARTANDNIGPANNDRISSFKRIG